MWKLKFLFLCIFVKRAIEDDIYIFYKPKLINLYIFLPNLRTAVTLSNIFFKLSVSKYVSMSVRNRLVCFVGHDSNCPVYNFLSF